MTDRPQYGEYGTEQEQQALIKEPLHEPEPPAQPDPARRQQGSAEAARPSDKLAGHTDSAMNPAAKKTGPMWDRILTVVLLVYMIINGLATVAVSPSRQTIEMMVKELSTRGYSFPNIEAINYELLQMIVSVGSLVLMLLVLLLSYWGLKRGRISFWIPLCGMVANIFYGAVVIAAFIMSA